MKTIRFKIGGTSCISCKTLIESELEALKGVKTTNVDYISGEATAEYDDSRINAKQIKGVIKNLGYEIIENDKKTLPKKKVNFKQWGLSILIIFALYFIYTYLSKFNLIPDLNINENLSYPMALLVGVVASVSTCLMVVGAVIISFSAKYKNKGNFYQSSVKPHLLFHLGRLMSFFVLGGILGMIGSLFTISANFMSWISIIVALILLWLALDILNILPAINFFQGGANKKIGKKWQKLKESNNSFAPLALGGLSFFLPCGFTQSMQVFAMASGSFLTGALIMLMFALGTLPVLMGLGITSNKFKNIKSGLFSKVAGIAIIIFAFYTLTSALAVQGININLINSTNSQTEAKADSSKTNKNEQVVEMVVDYKGYTPSVITLEKGVPVKWVIKGEQVSGCSNEVIVPSFNIKKKISKGDNIVRFTPYKEGTINFSCWMGMIRGKFIVKDKI
jgi:sulfite exporter TauE/SafE/copper chaperone CopZ